VRGRCKGSRSKAGQTLLDNGKDSGDRMQMLRRGAVCMSACVYVRSCITQPRELYHLSTSLDRVSLVDTYEQQHMHGRDVSVS
jgi:hypothetical protein